MWLVRFFLLSIVILVSYTTKAYAYLDPGFFSMIINFFIALIAGAAAYVSLFWSKIKKIFNMKKKVTKNDKKKT